MRATRVTEDKVRAAVRSAGMRAFGEADAVVLETDASFSVIARKEDGENAEIPSLLGVRRS